MNRQIGVVDSKYVGEIYTLGTGHVIRRMRSSQKRSVSGIQWKTSRCHFSVSWFFAVLTVQYRHCRFYTPTRLTEPWRYLITITLSDGGGGITVLGRMQDRGGSRPIYLGRLATPLPIHLLFPSLFTSLPQLSLASLWGRLIEYQLWLG